MCLVPQRNWRDMPILMSSSVVQQIRRWYTEVVVPRSSPARGWDLFNCNWCSIGHSLLLSRAPVTQWAKRRPTDPAVTSSCPARGEIFSIVNGVQVHTAFHYRPAHCPDVTENCWKGRETANHLSIHPIPNFELNGLRMIIYFGKSEECGVTLERILFCSVIKIRRSVAYTICHAPMPVT